MLPRADLALAAIGCHVVRISATLLANGIFLREEALINGGTVDEPLEGIVQHCLQVLCGLCLEVNRLQHSTQ